MNVRIKCGACGIIFATPAPLCPGCQAQELAGKPGAMVGWVVYQMVPVDAGPFFSARDRDDWFMNMHRTHPHLVGRRVDAVEEVVSEDALLGRQRKPS